MRPDLTGINRRGKARPQPVACCADQGKVVSIGPNRARTVTHRLIRGDLRRLKQGMSGFGTDLAGMAKADAARKLNRDIANDHRLLHDQLHPARNPHHTFKIKPLRRGQNHHKTAVLQGKKPVARSHGTANAPDAGGKHLGLQGSAMSVTDPGWVIELHDKAPGLARPFAAIMQRSLKPVDHLIRSGLAARPGPRPHSNQHQHRKPDRKGQKRQVPQKPVDR